MQPSAQPQLVNAAELQYLNDEQSVPIETALDGPSEKVWADI